MRFISEESQIYEAHLKFLDMRKGVLQSAKNEGKIEAKFVIAKVLIDEN